MLDYDAVAELRQRVSDRLAEEASRRRTSAKSPLGAEEERALAARLTAEALQEESVARLADGLAARGRAEVQEIAEAVDALLFGMGRIQRYLNNADIDNVVIHGAESVVIEWCNGTVTEEPSPWTSTDELEAEIRSIAARHGRTERRFDTGHPRLDIRLPEGSRLTAVMSVVHTTTVVIRRHRFLDLDLGDLERLGTIDGRLRHFLETCVMSGQNTLVAGKTNVGKTTLLRALLACCDPLEHIVTIETSLELGLHTLRHRHRHVTALEAREANAEGEGEVSVATMVTWALRLNPDRMVVGEVLGDEVLPMLNAMGNGASGSMTTLHARSSEAVARRLAAYASQAPRPIDAPRTAGLAVDALDIIVFLDKVPDDQGRRRRVVTSVREVIGLSDGTLQTQELFTPGADGRAVPAPILPQRLFELECAGLDRSVFVTEGSWR
jgi:pilus assembly protein CpaF